jgi:deoxyuridine 5'-triphosphate nucleotidohydrolase
MAKIRIRRIDKDLPLPEFDEADPKTLERYDKSQVAAFDLFCREDKVIPPHELALVAVNNVIETPPDCFLLLAARSSTPWKKGLMLANGIGIIDPFYSGNHDELKIQLLNFTDKSVKVKRGETLAQGVIVRREPVEWEEVDEMGADGHGGYKTNKD